MFTIKGCLNFPKSILSPITEPMDFLATILALLICFMASTSLFFFDYTFHTLPNPPFPTAQTTSQPLTPSSPLTLHRSLKANCGYCWGWNLECAVRLSLRSGDSTEMGQLLLPLRCELLVQRLDMISLAGMNLQKLLTSRMVVRSAVRSKVMEQVQSGWQCALRVGMGFWSQPLGWRNLCMSRSCDIDLLQNHTSLLTHPLLSPLSTRCSQLEDSSSGEWVIYQFELMEGSKVVLKGYLYIIVESFNAPDQTSELTCNISLGIVAKCNTQPSLSGKVINEVFLMEVPEEPSRLVFELKNHQGVVGDCRYDVNPFFNHPGAAHSISSDLFDNSQQVKGSITTKITYYSAEHGKLKLRVFHLSLIESLVQKYKTARLKTKIGIYAQTSSDWKMDTEFDHTFDLLILLKNGNLEFDVFCNQGILGKYQIYDLEKSGLMVGKPKAYQVSLFNGESPVGTIKYQVDWLH